jgi:hypothetical protein
MSTRSVVARPVGTSWEGRYCHYDGYLEGNGSFIWKSVTKHFHGDVQAAIDFFVKPDLPDDAGHWGSLMHAFNEPGVVDCKWCEGTGDRGEEIGKCNVCENGKRQIDTGWLEDNGGGWVTSWGDPSGTEFVYVLRTDGLQVFERSYYGPHEWSSKGLYPWDGPTPSFVTPDEDDLITAAVADEPAPKVAYKRGDPDPTPPDIDERTWCGAVYNDGQCVCTWPKGHPSDVDHVAGSPDVVDPIVLACWPTDDVTVSITVRLDYDPAADRGHLPAELARLLASYINDHGPAGVWALEPGA